MNLEGGNVTATLVVQKFDTGLVQVYDFTKEPGRLDGGIQFADPEQFSRTLLHSSVQSSDALEAITKRLGLG